MSRLILALCLLMQSHQMKHHAQLYAAQVLSEDVLYVACTGNILTMLLLALEQSIKSADFDY